MLNVELVIGVPTKYFINTVLKLKTVINNMNNIV